MSSNAPITTKGAGDITGVNYMEKKSYRQWVKTDEKNRSTLYSQYENGMIKGEPISNEEAAQYAAEYGGF